MALTLGIFCGLLAAAAGILLLAASAFIIVTASFQVPLYQLTLAIVLVRACGLGRAFFRYGERYLSHKGVFSLLDKVRCALYEKAMGLLPLKLGADADSRLLYQLNQGLNLLQDGTLRGLIPLGKTLLLAAIMTGIFYQADFWLALPLAMSWLGSWGITGLLAMYGKNQQLDDGFYREALSGMTGGRAEIMAARGTKKSLEGLDNAADRLGRQELQQSKEKQRQALLANCWQGLCLVMLLWAIGQAMAAGKMNVVMAAVYLLAFQAVLTEWQGLGEVGENILKALTIWRDIKTNNNQATSGAPAPSLEAGLEATAAAEATIAEKASINTPILQAEHVSFSYDGHHMVLDDLNLSVYPGERIALLGESGSGKTTLFYLLLNLWPVDKGKLSYAGMPYEQLSVDVRQYFSAATQGNHLFNGSIRENFQRLRPGLDESAIKKLLTAVGLDKMLCQLPQGLDQGLGSNGSRLSGGQRQRLLTALALAGNAPILLLDEPTASLDKLSAHQLLRGVQDNIGNRTLIVITHEPDVAAAMDRRLVLRHGQLQSIC